MGLTAFTELNIPKEILIFALQEQIVPKDRLTLNLSEATIPKEMLTLASPGPPIINYS